MDIISVYSKFYEIFKGNKLKYDVQFRIKHIHFLTKDANCRGPQPMKLCERNLDLAHTLIAFTEINHEDFCLAHLFTSRLFEKAIGMAYIGNIATPSIGLCSNNSKNAAFSSRGPVENPLPMIVSAVTLAHEIGHNMGCGKILILIIQCNK